MTEWRFRMFLDMYIVYIGMFMAILFNRTSQLKSGVVPTSYLDQFLKLAITYNRLFRVTIVILSLLVLPGFWALTRGSPDKEDYNWWHPFISFMPILSFVALRNSNRIFRNYYSKVFAWLGRCSLETYVLQFHIWLAGDTKGLLRLGLWNRWLEAALLTGVFFWVSWNMSSATQIITEWIVGTSGAGRRDYVAIVVGSKPSPYMSPLMQETPATPSKDMRFDIGGPRWLGRLIIKVKDDLRWRLGLILLLLWLGNVCYN